MLQNFIANNSVVAVVVGILVVGLSFFIGYKLGQIKSKLAPVDITASTITESKQCFERNFTLKSKGKVKLDVSVSTTHTDKHTNVSSHDDTSHDNEDRVISPTISPASSPESPGRKQTTMPTITLEESLQDMKRYEDSIDKARNVLHSIIGTTRALYNEYDLKRSWQMIFSNGVSQFYTSKSKEDGILIRGTSLATNASPLDIVRWMTREDLLTGLEGICNRVEVLQKIVTNEATEECVIVKRLCCKAGALMSSKRDFILITSVSLLSFPNETDPSQPAQNGYIICTRSVPEDFISPQRGAKSGGYIRGLVFGSGYILKPVPASQVSGNVSVTSKVTSTTTATTTNGGGGAVSVASVGTDISYAVHMDMLGSRSGRTNVSKTTTLVTSTVTLMGRIQSAEITKHSSASSGLNSNAPPSVLRSLSVSSEEKTTAHTTSSTLHTSDSSVNLVQQSGSGTNHVPNSRIQLTCDEKDELVSVAKTALVKLRGLHQMLEMQSKEGGSSKHASFDASANTNQGGTHSSSAFKSHTGSTGNSSADLRWEDFYSQDGVVLRELNGTDSQLSPLSIGSAPSFGVLSATCTIDAPPHIVRTLLVDHPDAIDGLLEGRSVLNYLTATTYVQWLAYGAIYPMGAKDFLLVTSEEVFNPKLSSDGSFVIASTSIDDICEMDHDSDGGEEDDSDGHDSEPDTESDAVRLSEDSVNNTNNGSSKKKLRKGHHGSGYNRSCLKLAGYVGVANENGGTDLTLLIDLDIYSDSPAWLLQLLSQYGLTEVMNRIRKTSVESYALSLNKKDSGASKHGAQSGSVLSRIGEASAKNTSSELSKMLLSIRNREMKMMAYNLERNQALNNNLPEEAARQSYSNANQSQKVYTNYKHTPTGKTSYDSPNQKVKKTRAGILRSAVGRATGSSKNNKHDAHDMNSDTEVVMSKERHMSVDSREGSGSERVEKEKKSRFRSNSISNFVMNNSPSISMSRKHRKNGSGDQSLAAESTTNGRSSPVFRDVPSVDNLTLLDGPVAPGTPSSRQGVKTVYREHRTNSFTGNSSGGGGIAYTPSTDLSHPSGGVATISRTGRGLSIEVPPAVDVFTSSTTDSNTTSNSGGSTTPKPISPIARVEALVHVVEESSDPVVRQGLAISALARMKILLYLKLPTDHLKLDKDLADVVLDWALKVSKPALSIYTSMTIQSTWQAIRAVTVMKAEPQALLSLLTNDARMGEYDDMFDFHQFIYKVNDHTAIRRLCFKAVWPTAPRDFLICTSHQTHADGSVLIVTMSAPDTLCPQQKGYVRGNIQISGYHIQPYQPNEKIVFEGSNGNVAVQPGECKVTLTAHTELGGTLPVSVINMLSTNAPMKILQSVADIMKKGK